MIFTMISNCTNDSPLTRLMESCLLLVEFPMKVRLFPNESKRMPISMLVVHRLFSPHSQIKHYFLLPYRSNSRHYQSCDCISSDLPPIIALFVNPHITATFLSTQESLVLHRFLPQLNFFSTAYKQPSSAQFLNKDDCCMAI